MRILLLSAAALALVAAQKLPGTADVLAASTAADWRPIAPDDLLVMDLPHGRVLIELAPAFAPNHAANIRTLARERWFDGTTVNRVQDNYVTQWGDATEKKPLGSAKAALAPEFTRPAAGLAFTPLPGADGYGEAGHSDSWPAVRARGEAWLAHCYAMVGVGRGDIAGSGSGAELYAVIGHAPRHLDRNITLAGRVVQGIEHLSALPRGAAALGFYDKPEQRITIRSVRLASELPAAERPALEVLRSGTPAWSAYVAARANRTRDGWFTRDAGHVDLCNIRVPVRAAEAR